ncbi:hypothetical protein EMCRGX_G008274 [Ephydatia muelleri]
MVAPKNPTLHNLPSLSVHMASEMPTPLSWKSTNTPACCPHRNDVIRSPGSHVERPVSHHLEDQGHSLKSRPQSVGERKDRSPSIDVSKTDPVKHSEALQVLVHVLKPPKLLSYSDHLLAALHLQRVPVGEETPAKPQVEREPRDIAAKTLLDTHHCLVIPRRRTRGNLEEEDDKGAVNRIGLKNVTNMRPNPLTTPSTQQQTSHFFLSIPDHFKV